MTTTGLADVLARGADRSRVQRARGTKDWIVYGAGRMGLMWAAALAGTGAVVHAFIDQNASRSAIAGLPAYTLAECPDDLRKGSAVLIALHNPGVDVAAVRHQLHAAGFDTIWLLQDLIDAWPQLAHFWLARSSETLPHADDIAASHDALADDASRALLVALLDQRLNGNADALPAPDPDNHYLPAGVPRPSSPLRYIDCGAYTGDTIEGFRRNGFAFEEIAAFEPDPAHFPRLCEAIGTTRASVFPCGTWAGMAQLRFSSDDSASHIHDAGDITVQTVALDQALPNFAPNLLKMDIEGAEHPTLLGARRTIEQHRPFLAISTYHKPRDLWDLMLLVHRWDLGYRFRLRSHAFNGFETVLYGEPA